MVAEGGSLQCHHTRTHQSFNSKLKSYDQYVEELRAWCIVTDLAKEKQGVAIALSLAESDPSGVLDKVFNEIA